MDALRDTDALLLGDRRQPLGMVRPHGRFAFEHALLYIQVLDLPQRIFDQRRRRVLPEREARAQRALAAVGLKEPSA